MDFVQQSCEAFVEVLASKSPAPGGGGAAALVGAVGMALGNMVGSLTLGKKKYAHVEADIIALKAQADELQRELLALVQQDAAVFEPLSRAYGMPKATPGEQAEKARVMEEALLACCEVPLAIMAACCRAIDLHGQFADKGTALAISDAGCGVVCCKAALQAASLNVSINTKAMSNRAQAQAIQARAQAMLTEYERRADAIYGQVAARLR